jgi:hypothetical protein
MTTDELLERMLLAMEKMIDAQDDMWEEEKYSNYRYRDKIKQEVFLPAKTEFKELFTEVVLSIKEKSVE